MVTVLLVENITLIFIFSMITLQMKELKFRKRFTVTKQLATQVKETEPCTRLMELEGVGKAGAAALYAALGDGTGFKNGRLYWSHTKTTQQRRCR